MKDWRPSAAYEKIAEANRAFYSRSAEQYEATETCVCSPRCQAELESEIDRVLTVLGKPRTEIRALDACGGSGNISLKLLKRGAKVTLVDISPELQRIFSGKCASLGFTPQIVCSEIASYLSETDSVFDLITFSSALHHLENIDEVLTLAFGRLAPGGLLYTVFDPTLRDHLSLLSKIVLRLEYYGFKLFCQTADFPKALLRRLSRIFSGSGTHNKSQVAINDATVGMLAEYHVETGIDDLALTRRLQQVGYEIVRHERTADTRFRWTGRIVSWQNDVTSFGLLLRKPFQA